MAKQREPRHGEFWVASIDGTAPTIVKVYNGAWIPQRQWAVCECGDEQGYPYDRTRFIRRVKV